MISVTTWIPEALPKKSYGPAKSLKAEVKDEEFLDLVRTALKGESQAAPLPIRPFDQTPTVMG